MNPSVRETVISQIFSGNFQFPLPITGMPKSPSEFKELQIRTFSADETTTLTYWEAGRGTPLIILPGWSSNGAEFFYLFYLLRNKFHVYVLDPRNQGLSDRTCAGMRIARYAADLRMLIQYLALPHAIYCGWSMGASILYSYIDIYGSKGIDSLILVDEPPSILSRPAWSERKCLNTGARFKTVDELLHNFTSEKGDDPVILRSLLMDSPYYQNAEIFSHVFIQNDMRFLSLILYDHASQDWSDVIQRKIDIPTAIFTGEYSPNLPSQQWMKDAIPNARLFIYKKEEQGDHFLMLKNPQQFAEDLQGFIRV